MDPKDSEQHPSADANSVSPQIPTPSGFQSLSVLFQQPKKSQHKNQDDPVSDGETEPKHQEVSTQTGEQQSKDEQESADKKADDRDATRGPSPASNDNVQSSMPTKFAPIAPPSPADTSRIPSDDNDILRKTSRAINQAFRGMLGVAEPSRPQQAPNVDEKDVLDQAPRTRTYLQRRRESKQVPIRLTPMGATERRENALPNSFDTTERQDKATFIPFDSTERRDNTTPNPFGATERPDNATSTSPSSAAVRHTDYPWGLRPKSDAAAGDSSDTPEDKNRKRTADASVANKKYLDALQTNFTPNTKDTAYSTTENSGATPITSDKVPQITPVPGDAAPAPVTNSSRMKPAPKSAAPAPVAKSLTHVNAAGEVHMVNVGSKDATKRTAVALSSVYFSNPDIPRMISENQNGKGDVLAVSRVAGIMAAKKAADIIPLCHPIAISKVGVDVELIEQEPAVLAGHIVCAKIRIQALVECVGPTGVEMEALAAASAAALTVYDMCKAVDRDMHIGRMSIVFKTGGNSGTHHEVKWAKAMGENWFVERGLEYPIKTGGKAKSTAQSAGSAGHAAQEVDSTAQDVDSNAQDVDSAGQEVDSAAQTTAPKTKIRKFFIGPKNGKKRILVRKFAAEPLPSKQPPARDVFGRKKPIVD